MNDYDREKVFSQIMPRNYGRFDLVEALEAEGFFKAPASTKYHGNYEGGLFDHSLKVTETLVELTDKLGLEWHRPESPYIVGMFHDLCKIDAYKQDFETNSFVRNGDLWLPGHGEKSVILAQLFGIDLTVEEIACVRWHMGAFETDTHMWAYYDRAIEEFNNVLWTHTADMIASQIYKT